MNPQRDYEQGDPTTVRAFFTLFRKCGDEFQFAVDGTDHDHEVRASLSFDSHEHGGTVIMVTAFNEKDRFESIMKTLRSMGLNIVQEDAEDETDDDYGDYTVYLGAAKAPDNLSAEWNVPHLLVYGWLSPEIEEAFTAAFGHRDGINIADVRNHYLVYGEGLTSDDRDELSTAIQRSNEFFDDDQRNAVSDIRTADYV